MMTGSGNLWVDTDMGFDDMHALLVLRQHGITPAAQSLVFGCTPLSQVVNNAQGFNQLFQGGRPWHIGASSSLDGHTRTAVHVLGRTGLQTRGEILPEGTALQETSESVSALIDWLSSNPDKPEILALGPLTNIARLCLQAPKLIKSLTRLTWMGGSTGRGNQTAFSEFNAWADPQAADIVFQSGIPTTMVDLELCRQIQLMPQDLLPLSRLTSSRARLLHDLLGGYLDIGLSRGRSCMALYDPVAAAAIVAPDAFSSRSVSIRVETNDSAHQGQTSISVARCDMSLHSVLELEDGPRVKNLIMAALLAAACVQD